MPKEFRGFSMFSPSNSAEMGEGEKASPENRVRGCLYLFFSRWRRV
jgi:hypothetical protein